MTKSQRFAYEAARSGPKRPKQPKRPRRDFPVDTARPGVSATDRKAGLATTADRNLSSRAARKATFALEDSRPPRPSRKSTRQASNRAKPDTNLRLRTMRAVRAPKSRAARATTRT